MSDYGIEATDGWPALYEKTPDEAIVVRFNWATKLDGETISLGSYELPDGLINEADTTVGTVKTVRVAGGNDGEVYRVIGKITTSANRDLEWVQRVTVRKG